MPFLFPYPLLTCFHASRASATYLNNAYKAASYRRLPWGTYISGFLVLAWGGSLVTHFLLSIPPPQLYSIHPWINYISVHLFITISFEAIPPPLWPRIMVAFDTISPVPDALVRTSSIINALSLLSTHPSVSPALSGSWFTHLVVAATAAGGGGALAGTFNVWDPDWRFSTPIFLHGGVIKTLDIWSGCFSALIYGTLMCSQPFEPVHQYVVSFLHLSEPESKQSIMSEEDAKSVIACMLSALFLWRAIVTHWLPLSGHRVSAGRKDQ